MGLVLEYLWPRKIPDISDGTRQVGTFREVCGFPFAYGPGKVLDFPRAEQIGLHWDREMGFEYFSKALKCKNKF
jgi:hypothetical protein